MSQAVEPIRPRAADIRDERDRSGVMAMASTLTALGDPVKACETLLAAVAESSGCKGAALYRYTRSGVEHVAGGVARHEGNADEASVRLALGRGALASVLLPGRSALVLHASASESVVAVFRGSYPVILDETTAALLLMAAAGAQRERRHRADQAEAALAQSQMEAYALDLRETYQTAEMRAQELKHALDSLEETYEATVRSLALAAEAKDEATGGHLVRVQRYGAAVAQRILGDDWERHGLRFGFLLHDIGKLAVPDAVLRKPAPLTMAEWDIMRSHPTMGARILAGVPFLEESMEIVSAHHERWDGKGYPDGSSGEDIPLGARIFSVVDAFDAMTSNRPYRRGLSIEQAMSLITDGRGTQFWAESVDAFTSIPEADMLEMMHAGAADDVP